MHEVTLLYFDGCPSWRLAEKTLRNLADELDLDIRLERIDGPEDAERWQFRGSPTILVDGRDPFAAGDAPVGLACRLYSTPHGPSGTPTADQLRAAIA